jgi:hypothetical protein
MALVRNVPPARLPSQAVRAAAVLRAVDAAATDPLCADA